jgi:hypothetical protein
MSTFSKRTLFWTPRVLSMAFAGFLSLFALDVFSEKLGFWQTVIGLLMHLIPVLVVILVLVFAWHWEWIGAVLYAVAGLLYVAWTTSHAVSSAVKFSWILSVAGPAFVIAVLFLANWVNRRELRAFDN